MKTTLTASLTALAVALMAGCCVASDAGIGQPARRPPRPACQRQATPRPRLPRARRAARRAR